MPSFPDLGLTTGGVTLPTTDPNLVFLQHRMGLLLPRVNRRSISYPDPPPIPLQNLNLNPTPGMNLLKACILPNLHQASTYINPSLGHTVVKSCFRPKTRHLSRSSPDHFPDQVECLEVAPDVETVLRTKGKNVSEFKSERFGP
jgi:hypothetical protein